MDDLILWIAYNPNSTNSKKEAYKIKEDIIEKALLYSGGLELEEQETIEKTSLHYKNKFSGTIITTTHNPIKIIIEPYNKNITDIEKGKQKYPRYTPKDSYVPDHQNNGTLIGTINRLAFQSSNEDIFLKALIDNNNEMKICGYKTIDFITNFIKITKKNPRWKVTLEKTWEKLKHEIHTKHWRNITKKIKALPPDYINKNNETTNNNHI